MSFRIEFIEEDARTGVVSVRYAEGEEGRLPAKGKLGFDFPSMEALRRRVDEYLNPAPIEMVIRTLAAYREDFNAAVGKEVKLDARVEEIARG